jgi:hypothetical protein
MRISGRPCMENKRETFVERVWEAQWIVFIVTCAESVLGSMEVYVESWVKHYGGAMQRIFVVRM